MPRSELRNDPGKFTPGHGFIGLVEKPIELRVTFGRAYNTAKFNDCTCLAQRPFAGRRHDRLLCKKNVGIHGLASAYRGKNRDFLGECAHRIVPRHVFAIDRRSCSREIKTRCMPFEDRPWGIIRRAFHEHLPPPERVGRLSECDEFHLNHSAFVSRAPAMRKARCFSSARVAAANYNTRMLSVTEARALIAQIVHVLPPIRVPLAQARGRILRESLVADEDIPAFDRSAMDGYAIASDDPSTEFRILCEIPAGTVPTIALGHGDCARIFTGSAIPEGANQVIVQEVAKRMGNTVSFSQRGKGRNIRMRGEDAREGSVLIERGAILGPVELSLGAQLGKTAPLVAPRPRIFHIATGSELVAPDAIPGEGKIRDSNSTLVAALAAESGADVVRQLRVGDEPAELVNAINGTEVEGWDALLLSGGASVGDHDFGTRTLRELGFSIHFAQLNLRPGKPLTFGTRGRQLAFVIPGNPLSHIVCWHLVIRAALDMLATGAIEFALVEASLAGNAALKGNARETWWPARIAWEEGGVRFIPLKWQSSGDLTGVIGLDSLIRVPAGIEAVQPGETICARLVRT